MSKSMLVNVTHVEESRVAVLEDGVLAEFEIETTNRTSLKGNIHNAVVDSVHPSLEASFVKLASGLNGFLPLDEVNFRLLPARTESRKMGKIGQHLHPGQKILAQVVREPFAGKPPTVSTYFSLPGRFLVLMPGVDSSGISRKIEDAKQRDRLKKILDELKPPEGFGIIVRTAGLGQTKTELQRDLRYLLRLWESIQRASGTTEFPGIVYREADLVIRTIRDHFASDIHEVWIDSEETFEKATAFVRDVMPSRAKNIKLYTGERPLFNKFNLEEQIERIYKRRVPLPSGGEIVIDGTEALTAVDVNSARSKKQADLEEMLLQTNVEAAAEIARQVRLRDLGGLIVIDFIDMSPTRNKKKVEKAMRDAMKGDKARYDLTPLSKLGLMEMARERKKGAKMAASYATCPACDGHGLIKNVETAGLAALRKLQTRTSRGDVGRLRVALPPEVALWMLNNKREELVRIERHHHLSIDVESKPSLLRHDCEVEVVPRPKTEEPPARDAPEMASRPKPTGDRPEVAVVEPKAPAAAKAEPTEVEEAPAKPRRRRRSRKTESTVAPALAPAPVPAPVADAADPPAESAPEAAETSSRVVPFTPKADNESEGTTTGDGETGNGRRRRRRRRKRRPGGDEDRAAQGDAQEKESAPAETPVVPQGVRSDELMPAASGSTDGARRKSGGGGAKRRKPSRGGRGRSTGSRRSGGAAPDGSED